MIDPRLLQAFRDQRPLGSSSTEGELGGRGETVRKIRAAFEASGIEFIEENETGEMRCHLINRRDID